MTNDASFVPYNAKRSTYQEMHYKFAGSESACVGVSSLITTNGLGALGVPFLTIGHVRWKVSTRGVVDVFCEIFTSGVVHRKVKGSMNLNECILDGIEQACDNFLEQACDNFLTGELPVSTLEDVQHTIAENLSVCILAFKVAVMNGECPVLPQWRIICETENVQVIPAL